MKRYLLLIAIFLNYTSVYANTVITIGPVFTIAEPDLIQVFKENIKKSNALSLLNLGNDFDRPEPVLNIKTVIKNTTRIFNPSIIAPYDLLDNSGKVIVRSGTEINPLNSVNLDQPIAFYDADDAKQIKWAFKINRIFKNKVLFVLVKGSIKGQMQLFNRNIYFDQNGRISNHFHIFNVPSLITQVGNRLRIDEIVP